MKNKQLPLIIGVVVLVVIALAAYFMMNKGSMSSSNPADIVSNALSGNGSMKCEYDEEGRHIVAYVKGEKMRTDITGGQEGPMSMIYKDRTSWTWNTDTKEGMMFKAPEITPVEGQEKVETETVEETAPDESEEMKAEIEKYKESCKNEGIADSLFEAPTDVTFQDYSQMMQQTQNQVPAGFEQYMQPQQ